MKICLYNVTTTFAYGGIETYCIEMGKALVQRGHEVSIVAGRSDVCIFQESSLRVVQYPFRRRASFPDFGTRFRKLMERLSFGRHAWRHLLVADYDAIVVTKPFDFPVLWWVKRRGLRASVMFHAGGTDFFLGDRLFANAVDRWAACSDHTAAQVAARYTRQVSTITNGVDPQRFTPAPPDPSLRLRWQIPEQAPLIMSVGRLVGLKGLRVIIEALTGLPQAHYMVVGEGDERGRLEKLAQDLDIKTRVHFLGSIANEKLPEILRAADLFVQPTIGEEAFGITVVEAMAVGLAVAASNNGGMREIINHEKNGVLLPSGDVSAWREVMGSLLQNPDRRRELGTNARMHVEQHFTWQAKAEQLERLLQGDSL